MTKIYHNLRNAEDGNSPKQLSVEAIKAKPILQECPLQSRSLSHPFSLDPIIDLTRL